MNKTVWVVDDDESILDVINIVLQQEGFNTTIINDPSIIKDEIKSKGSPDLILLDVLMSGVDGRDIAKQLKGDKSTAHIPIIIMTADVHADIKAEEAGANDFLRKPFDIDDLLLRVTNLLR